METANTAVNSEFLTAMTDHANERFQQMVDNQNLYGRLINWRSDKINDEHHKAKVFTGYAKIMKLISR